MRIAFFGGTFDPPHNGHLELARHILERHITDCVLFVPAYDPPHKLDREISTFDDRFAMLELLVAGESSMRVSDIERRAALKPSYSIKILKLLEKEFPGDKLQILIGGDSLEALRTWRKAKEIVAQYEIICYPRKGYEVDRESLLKHWASKEIDILLKSVLQMPFFDISSTSVRNHITDKAVNKNIKASILKYIKNKGLYFMTKKQVAPELIAELCAKEAGEKKALDIVSLKVSELTTIADYFVLCTAQSEPQMRALANWIQKSAFEKLTVKPVKVNGESVSKWILIDFGTVIVHIMTPEMRDRYQLEKLWGDAPKLEDLQKLEKISNS